MNTPAIVADTTAAVIRQTKLDERFHADLAAAFATVYAAGAASSATVTNSVPLTDAEIAVVRASLLAE